MDSSIKRVDLHLRGNFSLETTIYKIDDHKYVIHCQNLTVEEFKNICEVFERKLKPIALQFKLSTSKPMEYLSEIQKLEDDEIPRNFSGVAMTATDLYNTLLAKFPQINIYKIDTEATPITVHVYELLEKTAMGTTKHYLGESNKKNLQAFLDALDMGVDFIVVQDQFSEAPKLSLTMQRNPVQYLNAVKLSQRTQKFSQRDESIWFDNIDAIYQNTFKKKDLYFFDEDDYCCYADFTGGDHIDIRNFLFLYKTVYITPPIETDLIQWLHGQRISEEEFLTLVENDRIRLILTQPEFRYYDEGFLSSIYEINNKAIISRRAVASLQQIDIIELANNYALKGLEKHPSLIKLCELVSRQYGSSPRDYYDLLTWPMRAMRSSFEALHFGGQLGLSNFGVNKIAGRLVHTKFEKDLDFEFTITAPNIHLAHALNATYYPYKSKEKFSDLYYAHVMGGYLNMFKNATQEQLGDSHTDNGLVPEHAIRLNPVDIIDINTYIPILEFDAILSEANAYPKGKRLMETLAGLSPIEREERIIKYNMAVNQKLKKSKLASGAIDLGGNILMDGAGEITKFAGVGTAVSLAKLAAKAVLAISPEIKDMIDQVIDGSRGTDSANIHFLTKINRVASIKKF